MSFKKLIIVLVVALTLELGVFNFTNLSLLLNPNIEKNKKFTLADMEIVNWQSSDGKLISKADPILIIHNVNTEIRTVEVEAQLDKPLPRIAIFYTNDQNKNFNETTMKVYNENLIGDTLLTLNAQVQDIRLDLGEDAGLVLSNLDVTINPARISFSISRVIAILLIYLSAVGLFALQRNPNYHLDKQPPH